MTRRILIADRGVAAVRVAKSLVESGYSPIGVYTKDDESSPHRRYLVEDREVSSYHYVEEILDAALEMGAEAVHPGYGSLSENQEFAHEAARRGLIFIGPPPSILKLAGDADTIKSLAEKIGVPTLPWVEVKKPEDVYEFARVHRYPVVIKAISSSGKSYGIAYRDEQVEKVIGSLRRDPRISSRDLKLYAEPYLEYVRLIEVQVLGDGDNIIHLYDRECTISRENRVVIEEAPSPILGQGEREKILEYALSLAYQLKYRSTGVIVFLYDTKSRGVYVSEIKTLITAEHGVSEMITRVDVVRKQVEISLYGSLDLKQSSIEPWGHSIGASILAENPLQGIVSQGVIVKYREPSGLGVRVESSIAEGVKITSKHDPLLSKITVWAPNRILAVSRFKRALDDYVIEGIPTNIPLLKRIVSSDEFTRGEYTLQLLNEKENYFREMIRESLEQQLATLVALLELGHSDVKKILEKKPGTTEVTRGERISGLKRSAWYYYTVLKHRLSSRIKRTPSTRLRSK